MWFWLTAALAIPPIYEQAHDSGAEHAADRALVVGLADYDNVQDVPFADEDARAVADLLIHTRGIPEDRVTKLIDPTTDELKAAVDAALAEVEEGGTLWLYFSGNGTVHEGDRIVLGADAPNDETFRGAGVGLTDMAVRAGKTPAANTVILTDTGFGGFARSGLEVVSGQRSEVPETDKKAVPLNVTVWTGTLQSQIPQKMVQADHGAFTYFMVGALRGWADGSLDGKTDGIVTLREAQEYVNLALPKINNRTQTPAREDRRETRDMPLTDGTLESGPDLDTLLEMEKAEGDMLGLLDGQQGGIAKSSVERPPFMGPVKPAPKGAEAAYVDSKGNPVKLEDLRTLAGQLPTAVAPKKMKFNTTLQAITGTLGGLALTPVAACGFTGGDLGEWCNAGFVAGGAVSVSGIVGVVVGAVNKGKAKGMLLDEANTALDQWQTEHLQR